MKVILTDVSAAELIVATTDLKTAVQRIQKQLVKGNFRQLAKELHPDTTQFPKEKAIAAYRLVMTVRAEMRKRGQIA
ncbi:MAG: hypothetical protein F6J98_02105 [Moorea sp. SIO4G2]|nr:hypothetical protein [Moorena sp. SIO4G2]